MKYRDFISLTNDEIIDIVYDIFKPKHIKSIDRDRINQTIDVTIVTDGWVIDDDGNTIDITDVVELRDPFINNNGITCDFSIYPSDLWRYEQYLFALGIHPLLKNNPYWLRFNNEN